MLRTGIDPGGMWHNSAFSAGGAGGDPSATPLAETEPLMNFPMNFLISDAWAQGEASATGGLIGLLPLVLIFVLFYFLLIRPQQKRAKQHREMVAAIKKGDEVVTTGGTLGLVTDVGENFITLDISNGVKVKVQKHAIASMMPKGTIKDS
jgi:preprotein translocase subunit YajC